MQGNVQVTKNSDMPVHPEFESLERTYARAILGAAQAASNFTLVNEFEDFISEVVLPHPQLQSILSSERISQSDKQSVIDRLLGGRASDLLIDALKVIGEHGRLGQITGIVRELRKLADEAAGLVRALVSTATPIDDNLANQIRQRLRDALHIEPTLELRTDPDLLGGLVIRIADTVYDGSLRTQLVRMREQLIQRSVHEIQSRRDRFCTSEGN